MTVSPGSVVEQHRPRPHDGLLDLAVVGSLRGVGREGSRSRARVRWATCGAARVRSSSVVSILARLSDPTHGEILTRLSDIEARLSDIEGWVADQLIMASTSNRKDPA